MREMVSVSLFSAGRRIMAGTMKNVQEMHQQNRQAWNEGAARYEEHVEQDIAFLRAGGRNFVAPELRYLENLGDGCRRAIHLQCAGGRDTLSLWNQGAAEVVGVDISERMIDCARQKSTALGAPAHWYCCDVLETPPELDGTADLVYTGRGALHWLMDIGAWARVVARLLVPGGRLYVFEGHPVAWILDEEAAEIRPDAVYGDYFSEMIHAEAGWSATYIGELDRPKEELTPKFHRQWTLGQIINPLIDAGLRLERLEEHPDQYSERFPNLPDEIARRVPQTFSLLMRKE
jgi:SAM-dependent methyltransferase